MFTSSEWSPIHSPERPSLVRCGPLRRTLEGAKFSATCWRRSDSTFKTGFVPEVFARLSEANEVLERRSGMREGYEAERLSVKGAASYATVEMLEMDRTFFQLQVEYPIREAAYMPEMVEKFPASFRRQCRTA